jgi:hypothetical protein
MKKTPEERARIMRAFRKKNVRRGHDEINGQVQHAAGFTLTTIFLASLTTLGTRRSRRAGS